MVALADKRISLWSDSTSSGLQFRVVDLSRIYGLLLVGKGALTRIDTTLQEPVPLVLDLSLFILRHQFLLCVYFRVQLLPLFLLMYALVVSFLQLC